MARRPQTAIDVVAAGIAAMFKLDMRGEHVPDEVRQGLLAHGNGDPDFAQKALEHHVLRGRSDDGVGLPEFEQRIDAAGEIAAGFYPHPTQDGLALWWDGSEWVGEPVNADEVLGWDG
jgi:Protein of unknown function (DUF2510)